MASIKLGNPPVSFTIPVKFSLIEGGDATINCTFKYRTRKEFGELIARTSGRIEAAKDGSAFADVMALTNEENATYLLEILRGWDLADDLSMANAQRLCDEYPAAPVAIMTAYRQAIAEGRRGN